LDEPYERTLFFDINKIVNDSIEELLVNTQVTDKKNHFTEIKLIGLNRQLQGRTLGKIKEHLVSIYRDYLRKNILEYHPRS